VKVTGQPVSVLFGGATSRLPAYASFGEARSPQARAEAALAAKAAGFRALKIRIGRTGIGTSLAAVRAVRAAVGDEIAVMADLHVVAGVGGGPYVEFPYDPPGWTEDRRDFFLTDPIRIDPDGYLTVPTTPGLGAEINPEALTRYPHPTRPADLTRTPLRMAHPNIVDIYPPSDGG
jgi:L-alanine-DL-glutamate epimerase-like enolase superfamily enzyme